jgi:Arc/MetJ-type ribon-helix-helix transcriptional regulator
MAEKTNAKKMPGKGSVLAQSDHAKEADSSNVSSTARAHRPGNPGRRSAEERDGMGTEPSEDEMRTSGQRSRAMGKEPAANAEEKQRTRIVNLRVPTQIVDDIDYWVDHRRYKSRSEFIMAAIRLYLDYIEYRESYNIRTFQRGQLEEAPSERLERLKYLKGRP